MKEMNVLKVHTTGIIEEPIRSTINLCVSMVCNNQFNIRTTTLNLYDLCTCTWVLDSLLTDEQLEIIQLFIEEILEDLDIKIKSIEQGLETNYKLF